MGLIDQIVGVESGGDPTARNPNSSATGAAQFISGTWLDMLSKYRPDLTGSKEELLALRNDPVLSREMAAQYAKDNGAVLSNAGLPVNPGTTYLAHFAGPQGAVKLLQADPTATAESILGAGAVSANPFLRGMTAADVRAWAERKMGAGPLEYGGASATQVARLTNIPQAAPSGPSMSIPLQAAPIFAQAPQAAPQGGGQAPSLYSQMPAEQFGQPPPIFSPPRKPIDIRALRAALARPPAGFFNGRG